MRPGVLFILPLLLGSALVAHGQIVDRSDSIGDLLRNRNVETASILYQDKKFQDTKSLNTSKKIELSQFQFEDKVRTKSFFTGQYYTGKPNFWAGLFHFGDKQANLNSRNPVNTAMVYETKTLPDKAAQENGKSYATSTYAGSHEYLGKGVMQDKFDKQGAKAMEGKNAIKDTSLHVMTIDEVRELLNKPK